MRRQTAGIARWRERGGGFPRYVGWSAISAGVASMLYAVALVALFLGNLLAATNAYKPGDLEPRRPDQRQLDASLVYLAGRDADARATGAVSHAN